MVFQNWNEKYQIAPINTSSPNELFGIERCLHRWDIIFCSSSFPNSADLERKWDLSSLMLWCAPCQQARKTVGNFEKYISGSSVLPLFTFRKFSQFSKNKTLWENLLFWQFLLHAGGVRPSGVHQSIIPDGQYCLKAIPMDSINNGNKRYHGYFKKNHGNIGNHRTKEDILVYVYISYMYVIVYAWNLEEPTPISSTTKCQKTMRGIVVSRKKKDGWRARERERAGVRVSA